jgi:ketosteroid isomerase-like protein
MGEAMDEWSDVWDDWEVQAERYVDAGEDRVLIMWRERGRGKGSGIAMEQTGANLVTIADGHIVHMRLYVDQQAALRAVGLAG